MLNRKLFLSLFAIISVLGTQLIAFANTSTKKNDKPVKFTVRIENISNSMGQTAKDGSKWPFALSPGMFVVHKNNSTLFKEGRKASVGLEMQAEDGNPTGIIELLAGTNHATKQQGIYNTPVGAMGPGPIVPGSAYEFTISGMPGMKFSMAIMFGQSNDLFYAPEPKGVELFKDGKPLQQDITNKLILWDAGTEVNQEEGVGSDQAPRQKSANTGADENSVVKKAKANRFYNMNGQLFRVTITPETVMGM